MIILASSSPQRRKLVRKCLWNAVPKKLKTKEQHLRGESIYSYLTKTVIKKASPFWKKSDVISADTSMLYKGNIIGKPSSRKEALNMLSRLQGSSHTCFTAVLVHRKGKTTIGIYSAQIFMKKMHKEEMEAYLNLGEFKNRAGGYAIQGKANKFTKILSGNIETVIGLPTSPLCQILTDNTMKIIMNINKTKVVGNINTHNKRKLRKNITEAIHHAGKHILWR